MGIRASPVFRWVVIAVALAGFGASRPRSDEDERAREWLARAAARAMDQGIRDDRELAGVALAVQALRAADAADWSTRADALRDRLGSLQRSDGSFGVALSSRPLTWLALGALRGRYDDGLEQRARAWLATSGASTDAKNASGTTEATRRALGFLRSARATETRTIDETALPVFALAGGPIDLREAYAAAMESSGAARRPFSTPAGEWLADPKHALAVGVAVLDHYRGSKEAALLAELARPSASILAELDSERHSATGAWPAQPGGEPDVVSTACALAARQTLERWERARAASETGELTGAVLGQRTAGNDCVGCHEALQPQQVADWRDSDHARKRVGCAECHGTNHSTIFRERGRVWPKVCGTCHAAAAEEFARTRDAAAEATLLASELFAHTPPAARAACIECHSIGETHTDGSRGGCNHCHAGHAFVGSDARQPEACTLCHTGADYPQDLAWRLSKHGALFELTRDESRSPSCATCHNPGGTHDDRFGLTIGSSGAGRTFENDPNPLGAPCIGAAEFTQRRAEMVAVCTRCHSSRLAEISLRAADELKREGETHLAEAREILRALQARGYFGDERELALGPEHARPDPGAAGGELLDRYYEMWRFHHAGAWKGAYHQSASITNHSSGIGTLDDLEHFRAAAARWSARGKQR